VTSSIAAATKQQMEGFFTGPESNSSLDKCSACGMPESSLGDGAKLKKCSRCRKVAFCGFIASAGIGRTAMPMNAAAKKIWLMPLAIEEHGRNY